MDPALQETIEKLAQYVSQSNGSMEGMVRERQRTNPHFAFLFGGEGAAYYQECLRKFSRTNGGAVPNAGGSGGFNGTSGFNSGGGGGYGTSNGGGG